MLVCTSSLPGEVFCNKERPRMLKVCELGTRDPDRVVVGCAASEAHCCEILVIETRDTDCGIVVKRKIPI